LFSDGSFDGEIQTLDYPPAALFSFCMAMVADNLLTTVKAALRMAHGADKVSSALSDRADLKPFTNRGFNACVL